LAATEDAELSAELDAMATAGIGAVEVFPYFTSGVNPAAAGWGTAAWSARLATIVRVAEKRGIRVELGAGPLAVPAVPMTSPFSVVGSARELVRGVVFVDAGTTYSDVVPTPAAAEDERELVAVVAAKVTGQASAKPILLDLDTTLDLTARVAGGRVNWTPPSAGSWALFGFWQRATGQPVTSGFNSDQPIPTTPNSYFVDHYGAAGAQLLKRFWDSNLAGFSGGEFLFLDSLELSAELPWTPALPARFQSSRGYSLVPFLPVLAIEGLHSFFPPNNATPDSAPDFDFHDGIGARIRNDYYEVLTELYQAEHLDVLRRWAVGRGWRLRAQVAYGATLELASSAAHVDVPETESLAFAERIDGYRAQAGAVHLTGSPTYSAELAPAFGKAYEQTLPDLIASIHTAYAGGVNQVMLHGSPYATAPGAHWPGWAPLAPLFSEAWGPRQPCWRHIPDVMTHLTRLQSIMHTGVARIDLAVFRHSYWDHHDTVYFEHPELAEAGYRHDFVAPALLELPTATVSGGLLAADGPGYRALVLDGQRTLPIPAARRILSFAQAGLPVVVIGAVPDRSPFFGDASSGDAVVRDLMGRLLTQPTVRRAEKPTEVVNALGVLGVRPSVEFQQPTPLLTMQRCAGKLTYFYFHNPVDTAVNVHADLDASGVPFLVNTWTGDVEPIRFDRADGRVRVSLDLTARESVVIAVSPEDPFDVDVSGSRVTYSEDVETRVRHRKQFIRACRTGTRRVTLADGRSLAVPIDEVPPPFELIKWDVVVADWQPGSTATTTKIEEHRFTLDGLRPWPEIDQVRDASGTATYTTTFVLDRTWTGGTGAYLQLGPVFHSLRVRVNGTAMPAADPRRPVVDLCDVLVVGNNKVEVEVTTTLFNRLRFLGSVTGTAPQPYGLIGPVRLIPYGQRKLDI
jgi:hypothetical protein